MELNPSSTQVDHDKDILRSFLTRFQLHVTNVHRRTLYAPYRLENHITQHYKLVYVISGESEVVCNGVTYHLKQGSMAITSPYTLFTTQHKGVAPVCYHNIFFEIHPIHLAPQFIETLHQLATDYIIFEDVEGLILPLFLQIEQELKNKKQGYSFVMDTLLQMIILQVIRHTPALGLEAKLKTKPQQNEASNILYQATQYIQTNLYSNLRIKEISLHVGVSDNYLFKLFKQYLHCSPSSYIINCKIKHACTMLESKQYTIQEIANHLGYSSAYHFSNVFKKEMGISPSKYVSQ